MLEEKRRNASVNSCLCATLGVEGSKCADSPPEMKDDNIEQDNSFPPESPHSDKQFDLSEVVDLTANTIPNGTELF